jgi:hypothetical protein
MRQDCRRKILGWGVDDEAGKIAGEHLSFSSSSLSGLAARNY